MNPKHIQLLIQIMCETKTTNFHAIMPQSDEHGVKPIKAVHNLPELELNNFRANFIGHIALHSITQSLGCAPDVRGDLIFGKEVGITAFMNFIQCDWHTARSLACGDLHHKGTTLWSNYFNKQYEKVTPADYVAKLHALLESKGMQAHKHSEDDEA